jgi:hypothetical protein
MKKNTLISAIRRRVRWPSAVRRPAILRHLPDKMNWSTARIALSLAVLGLFWGSVLREYWPDMVPGLMQTLNMARSVGAESIPSQYFDVRNNSKASEGRVQQMVAGLENEYNVLYSYLLSQDVAIPVTGANATTAPDSSTTGEDDGKLPLLVVNGAGPAVADGENLVINYDDGYMDTSLAPLYMVIMLEGLPLDMSSGLVPAGGHALQVVESAGLGLKITYQPLDDWAVLLRRNGNYLPLSEAWPLGMPGNDAGTYDLLRGVLEAGSFMHWFTAQYGIDTAQRMAEGADILEITGKTLEENERAWLAVLDKQPLDPKPCRAVVPRDSMFYEFCAKIDQTN